MGISTVTKNNMHIEINGVKLALIENYTVKLARETINIQAFGHEKAISTVFGIPKYTIDLSKIQISNDVLSNKLDFSDFSNFQLVIVKPHSKIIFSECEWVSISENFSISKPLINNISITATNMIEI